MKKFGMLASTTSLAILAHSSLWAQEVAVKAYTPPEVDKRVNPEYPNRAIRDGSEAMVEINMMIDDQGRPFDVMVTNSFGGKDFEEATIKAVEQWQYKPAMAEGVPIASREKTMLRYTLKGGESGASGAFIKAYKSFLEGVKDLPQTDLDIQLQTLQETGLKNYYERAFWGLANFMYANRFKSPLEQMHYLDEALSFSRKKEDVVFLKKDEAKFARQELFKLQVKNNYLTEALDTYKYFGEVKDKESLEMFKPVVEQINGLKIKETTYEMLAVLNQAGYFHIDMFKHRAYVTAVEGKIENFSLHCDTKKVEFAVEPDTSYDIPEQWGECSLFIEGDPGTKFKLGQQ